MSGGECLKLRAVLGLAASPAGPTRHRDILAQVADSVLWASDAAAALDLVKKAAPELILVWGLPPAAAGRFIRAVGAIARGTPVVCVSETPTVDEAVSLVRAGAYDYLSGPLDGPRLARLIEGLAAERKCQQGGNKRFFCEQCPPGLEIVGTSPAMVQCLETLRLVAESRCNPMLILGETGVGKELAARAVHWWRCGDLERFVAVNCAALTASLLESEFFGHVKGAFTGADRDKVGLFEQAHGGSIFLDEISEMPPELQAKLLRVVQENSFRRVGGGADVPFQATIIASSNKNLMKEIAAGRFRQDLYYRLAVFPIVMAPLRQEDRRADIPLLAEYFLRSRGSGRASGVALKPDALERLLAHDWPGNVRELRNVLERAAILAGSGPITADHLVFDVVQGAAGVPGPRRPTDEDLCLDAAERELILRALWETRGQRSRAAAMLGITRSTLYAKLRRHGIAQPDGAGESPPTGAHPPDAMSIQNGQA